MRSVRSIRHSTRDRPSPPENGYRRIGAERKFLLSARRGLGLVGDEQRSDCKDVGKPLVAESYNELRT